MESQNIRFINWLKVLVSEASPLSELVTNLEHRISSALVYMSHLGVIGVVQLLLSKGAKVSHENEDEEY